MIYADAHRLLDLCVEHELIGKTEDGLLAIYREASENYPEGWYAEPIDEMAKELMADPEGQEYIISQLRAIGVFFEAVYEKDVMPMLDQILGTSGQQF